MQKQQKLKPNRPDILIKVREKEVLFGEITGPSQETAELKNKWDLYRLARFGKSFLDNGHSSAPLLQIIYTQGTYLELTAQLRGMYLLQEVGVFTIPTTISMIPTLLADLPVLFAAQVRLAHSFGSVLNAMVVIVYTYSRCVFISEMYNVGGSAQSYIGGAEHPKTELGIQRYCERQKKIGMKTRRLG